MDPHPPDTTDNSATAGSGDGTPAPGDAPVEPTSAGDAATMAAELARVELERDAAVRALDKQGRRARRGARVRHTVVGALVVVFSLLLPITVLATWAHNSVLNDAGWIRTVGPIAGQPAVIDAVSREVTNELFTALNPQQLAADNLPPRVAFLAGPIANAARGYIQDAVTKILQSPQFQALWLQANRFAHGELVAVLRGNTSTLQTTNGQVVLNLVPLLNSALQSLQGFASGVVGKPLTLPTVTANELPSAACAQIAAALSRPVPPTCGQIALFPATRLTEARRAVRAFDRIVVLLLILTPLVVLLGLGLSRQRRRTLPNFAVGGLLGMVVGRRAVMWLQNTLINAGLPENKAARRVILIQVLHGFRTASYWVIVGLLIVLVIALFTGPYAWARALRHHIAAGSTHAGHLVAAAAGHATDDAAAAWVARHHDILRVAGVVVAALLVLVLSVSFIGLLLIAVLLALFEWWVHRMAHLAPDPAATPAAEPAGPAPTVPAHR